MEKPVVELPNGRAPTSWKSRRQARPFKEKGPRLSEGSGIKPDVVPFKKQLEVRDVKFLDNVKNYGLALPQRLEETFSSRYKVHVLPNQGNMIYHPISSGFRSLATARGLGKLYALGVRHVISVYGSDRDKSVLDVLNRRVKLEDQLQLTISGAMIVPQDIVRRLKDNSFDSKKILKVGLLLVDIYDVAGLTDSKFNLEFLRNLINIGPVCVVAHPFLGACGTLDNEGAWVRLPDGTILSRPDGVTPSYAAHNDINWLLTDGVAPGLAWTMFETVGSFRLVMIIETDLICNRRIEPIVEIGWEVLPVPDLNGNLRLWVFNNFPISIQQYCWRWLFKNRKVMVDIRLVNDLVNWSLFKNIDIYTVRMMVARARDLLGQRSHYKVLTELFPAEVSDLLEGCIISALIKKQQSRLDTLVAMNLAVGDQFVGLNHQQKIIGQVPLAVGYSSNCLTLSFIVFSILSLVFIAGFTNHTFSVWNIEADTTKIYLIIFAPLLEESLKRLSYPFGVVFLWLIIFFESAQLLFQMGCNIQACELWRVSWGLWGNLCLQHALIHIGLSKIPFLLAVIIHMLLNCLVLVSNFGLPFGYPIYEVLTGLSLIPMFIILSSLIFRWINKESFISNWDLFRKHYYDQPWNCRSGGFDTMIKSSRFDLGRGIVCKETVPLNVPVPVIGARYLRVEDKDQLLGQSFFEEPTRGKVYFLKPVNSPGYAPAHSDSNMVAVIQNRLLRQPPCDLELTADAWYHILRLDLGVYDDIKIVYGKTDMPDYILLKTQFHSGKTALSWADGEDLDYLYESGDLDQDELLDQWLKNFEGDKMRYNRALEASRLLRMTDITYDSKYYLKTEVFVKTNELLFQRDAAGYPKMNPRPIAYVSPVVQADIGPQIYASFIRFKEVFSPIREFNSNRYLGEYGKCGGNIPVYYSYGGASNDAELSCWMNLVLRHSTPAFFLLVSGDDIVTVIVDGKGYFQTAEADMTMFDQSQGDYALRYQICMMIAMGLPSAEAYKLDRIHYSSYLCPFKNKDMGVLLVRNRASRDTGGPDTAYGNSLTAGAATIFSFGKGFTENGFDLDLIERAYLSCGFKAKLKIHPINDATSVTFLKGKWWYSNAGYIWAPLPSRVLKFGKSLRDPVDICAGDRRQASEKFLAMQSANYDTFYCCPILREMVDNCADEILIPQAAADAYIAETNKYKIRGGYGKEVQDLLTHYTGFHRFLYLSLLSDGIVDGVWRPRVDHDQAHVDIISRYNVGHDLIVATARMIRTSERLSFLQSPLFEIMALVDYN